MKLYRWEEIKTRFTEGIILGNGASIAIDKRFSYASIFDNAKKNRLITKNVAKVFKYLEPLLFILIVASKHRPIDKEVIIETDDSFKPLQKCGYLEKLV